MIKLQFSPVAVLSMRIAVYILPFSFLADLLWSIMGETFNGQPDKHPPLIGHVYDCTVTIPWRIAIATSLARKDALWLQLCI